MSLCFFNTTRSFLKENTRLFDYINAATVGLWNLRLSLDAYCRAVPDASPLELTGRFVSGSNVHGANLKRVFQKDSWEDNCGRLAEFALIMTISNYESWCDGVLRELGLPNNKCNSQALQFPMCDRQKKLSYKELLSKLGSSDAMIYSFQRELLQTKGVEPNATEARLICYRCFKEMRNCLAHSNGLPSEVFLGAYTNYSDTKVTTKELGAKEKPTCDAPTKEKPIKPLLRGVIGFSAITRYLVLTFDCNLSGTAKAEDMLVAKWKKDHKLVQYPVNYKARTQQIIKLTQRLGYPKPRISSGIEEDLQMVLLRKRAIELNDNEVQR